MLFYYGRVEITAQNCQTEDKVTDGTPKKVYPEILGGTQWRNNPCYIGVACKGAGLKYRVAALPL